MIEKERFSKTFDKLSLMRVNSKLVQGDADQHERIGEKFNNCELGMIDQKKTRYMFLMFSKKMERTTISVKKKRCHRRYCYKNGKITNIVIDDIVLNVEV